MTLWISTKKIQNESSNENESHRLYMYVRDYNDVVVTIYELVSFNLYTYTIYRKREWESQGMCVCAENVRDFVLYRSGGRKRDF